MSGVFTLDKKGTDRVEEQAALNLLDVSQQAPLFWDDAGEATAKGVVQGLGVGYMMVGTTGALIEDKVMGTGTEARDAHFRRLDAFIDDWTPDPHTTGTAGQVGNGLAKILPPLLLARGNPAATAFGTTTVTVADTALPLVKQGVDAETAGTVAAVQGLTNLVGLKVPTLGVTRLQRVATGAVGNVAVETPAGLASADILDDAGFDAQAEQFAPTAESTTIAALVGAAFGLPGGGPRLSPSERAAVATLNNADHFTERSMPGVPKSHEAAIEHQDYMGAALNHLLNDEPVTLPRDNLDQFLRPAAANDAVASTFDNAVEDVLRAEGGFVDDPVDRGGATNFGISSAANPDVDVANLTREGAKAIYRERYWEPIGGDALPAPVRAMAFDAAVNQGVGWTKQALADAGGDPAKFIALREARYRSIVANDPSQAKFLKGWLNRLEPFRDDLENFGLEAAPRTIDDADPLLTETATLPDREALREQLVAEHFTGAEPRALAEGERPIAYVMGGGGASGKGTILGLLKDAGEVPRHGVVDIDPDRIKTGGEGISGIPEYRMIADRKDGRAAAVVHEESSMVAKQVLAKAIAGKYDLVLDRTLGDKAKGLSELNALKEAGYEVRLYGVTVDPKAAVQRAVKRAQRSGRYVPLDSLLKAHKGFADAFEDYAGVVDRAELYDNTGEGPVPIARAQGALTIEDAGAYNSFRERSQVNETATTYRALQARPDRADGPGGSQPDAGTVQGGQGEARRAGAGSSEGGGLAAGADGQAPSLTARAAADTVAAFPDLVVMGEDGVARPASEILAEADAQQAQAEETVRAIEAAAACFLRTAA